MAIDLILSENGISAKDTSIFKAKNILETQIGSLQYAPDFGIDYNLFFGSDLQIQIETYQAYAISKLSENGINPLDLIQEDGKFDTLLNINIENS
jgi:hypothetical protein